MTSNPLTVFPVASSVQQDRFDLYHTIVDSIQRAGEPLQDGDVLAISSKYVAISEGRVVDIAAVMVSERAIEIARRYNMNPRIAQLVLDEADHVFGGIPMGFLLTWKHGVIAPNAGLDRSNVPSGKAVLLPLEPYTAAANIRHEMKQRLGVDVGIILTDSWLVPGRLGTTGIALGVAGFKPVRDERGKTDLFGNSMTVTQVGIADSISVCAQMVMGERDEAVPISIVRNTGVELDDFEIDPQDVAIPWEMCIYVESLTLGLLEDGAPQQSWSARLVRSGMSV